MHPIPTPDHITSLEPNQIFVFGSNTEGRHGTGAAFWAMYSFDAQYGVSLGPTGRCFAIITKDLRVGKKSIPLQRIGDQIRSLMFYASRQPEKEFLVTKIGTELAGYTVEEIGKLFIGLEIPDNVRLPKEFIQIIQEDGRATETKES